MSLSGACSSAGSEPAARRLVEALASPRWMIAFFVFAAVGALAVAYRLVPATAAMPLPFALLTVNLVAAIAVRPALRADGALLLLHLALLALLGLFVVARLTYFEGTVSLNSGTLFEGQLASQERGPLHRDRLGEIRFANVGFTEDFPQRGKYKATYNRVRWQDAGGMLREAVIGDDHPLILGGYRIYTSRFRGFAPVFHWRAADGTEDLGSVHLNDTRSGEFAPTNEWRLPQGPVIWAMLESATDVDPAPGSQRSNLAVDRIDHRLVLRVGDDRHVMAPGETVSLAGGRLTYLRLDSWMGYKISHDPTRPWLLAAVMVVVGSLLWYYGRRLRARRIEE